MKTQNAPQKTFGKQAKKAALEIFPTATKIHKTYASGREIRVFLNAEGRFLGYWDAAYHCAAFGDVPAKFYIEE